MRVNLQKLQSKAKQCNAFQHLSTCSVVDCIRAKKRNRGTLFGEDRLAVDHLICCGFIQFQQLQQPACSEEFIKLCGSIIQKLCWLFWLGQSESLRLSRRHYMRKTFQGCLWQQKLGAPSKWYFPNLSCGNKAEYYLSPSIRPCTP